MKIEELRQGNKLQTTIDLSSRILAKIHRGDHPLSIYGYELPEQLVDAIEETIAFKKAQAVKAFEEL